MFLLSMPTYLKQHRRAVLLDSFSIVFALGFAVTCYRGSHGPFGGLQIIFGTAIIALASAFWMQLRLTPRIIFLSEYRRRQELALTFVQPRRYLRHNIVSPFLLLPGCAFCISFILVAIYSINDPEEGVFSILFLWICLTTAFATALSMTTLFLFFRWLCRAPRDPALAWLLSFLIAPLNAVVSLLLYQMNARLAGFLTGFYLFPFEEPAFNILFIAEILFLIWSASRLWRRCWMRYFVFENEPWIAAWLAQHWRGLAMGALGIALAIGYGTSVQSKWKLELGGGWGDIIDSEDHAVLFLARISLIAAAAPFWAQLRLTPRVIRLANKRRREHVARTLAGPAGYLARRLIRPYALIPLMPLCVAIAFSSLHFHELEVYDDVGVIPAVFFVAVVFCIPMALAFAISGVCFLLFFRWYCRSRQDPVWCWLISIASTMIGIAIFAALVAFNFRFTGFEWNGYNPSPPGVDAVFLVLFLCEFAFFCYAACRLWRKCCLGYFKFQ
ncbi:hypothetical protein LLG95_03685 [bacterium]|nr:hypothetical protein [bacterium]